VHRRQRLDRLSEASGRMVVANRDAMETLLLLVKVLSAVAVMGFGIYGLGIEPRGKEGKMTARGWAVLFGLVVSGLLSGAIPAVEFLRDQQKEQVEKARMQQLLTSVERSLYPIRGMTAGARFDLHPEFEPIGSYMAALRNWLKSAKGNCRAPQCLTEEKSDSPVELILHRTDDLFPRDSNFPKLAALLDSTALFLAFKKAPLEAPDDFFSLDASADKDLRLEFNVKENNLHLVAYFEVPTSVTDQMNAVSVIDLLGGQLVADASLKWWNVKQLGECVGDPCWGHTPYPIKVLDVTVFFRSGKLIAGEADLKREPLDPSRDQEVGIQVPDQIQQLDQRNQAWRTPSISPAN
jgi:hypothetical protein